MIAAATVAYCHEALGAMDTALKLTTDYLTTRKQFGITLNRFQALTFRAADMYTSRRADPQHRHSGRRWCSPTSPPRPRRSGRPPRAPSCRSARAGRHIGQEAIQLHGGIGMTAEYAVGHLTARLTAIDHLLGDGRQQVRNLSRRLTSYGVVEPLP